MNRGTKIALGAFGVILVLCGVGTCSLVGKVKEQLEAQREEAVAAGDEVLILVTARWEYEAFELRTSPEFKENVGDVEQKLGEWSEEYGPLLDGEAALDTFKVDDTVKEKPVLVAQVVCEATFEKKKGTVTMTLTREPGNAWLLSDFTVTPGP